MFILFFFIIGTVFGSFFNVCIYRIPRGESLVFPSSHCPHCNHPLIHRDLIPLFSYISLKGRCRYCQNPISWRYPLIETATGLLFAFICYQFGLHWDLLFYGVLISILFVASIIDLEHKIIPNGLVLVGVTTGLAMNAAGIGRPFMDGIYGFLTGGGILLLIALLSLVILRKEGMGGGDVKFMGMIGVFLGWKMTLLSLLLSIYLGGLASLILLVFRFKKLQEAIPYGPFIAIGTFITVFWGQPILDWYFGIFLR